MPFHLACPPLRVEAEVIERDGKLVALTPNVNPKEAKLTTLKRHVGIFWKIDRSTGSDVDNFPRQPHCERQAFLARASKASKPE